jgi:hypothetical protein
MLDGRDGVGLVFVRSARVVLGPAGHSQKGSGRVTLSAVAATESGAVRTAIAGFWGAKRAEKGLALRGVALEHEA